MQKRSIHLVPITELDTDAQFAIRELRNDPDLRKIMYTDHEIGVNEHLQWISRLKTDRRQVVFGVMGEASRALGVLGLSALDVQNKRSDWGFYLASQERGRGLGTAMLWQFIEFAFGTIGLEKLNASVLESNGQALLLHKKLGFEEEGFRKSEVSRNGERIGVHLLGLSKHAWKDTRCAFEERYKAVFDRFAIEIHWSPDTESLTPIDQIEAARARNNVNWMNILRIAVEKSPIHAKQLVAEIKEIDQHISALTAKITVEP